MIRAELAFSLSIPLLLLLTACATAPTVAPARPVTPSAETSVEVERKLDLVREPSVERYLQGIVTKLLGAPAAPMKTRIYRASRTDHMGNEPIVMADALYFPLRALRESRFENEVAAIAAIGLSARAPKPFEAAVELLYRAGFDPRGVVAVAERQNTDEQKIADARARIALYPPLRNPVVSTDVFASTMRRLSRGVP